MKLLYTSGDEKIFDEDFLKALRSIGIEEGDVLFIHSDVTVFGRLALTDKKTFLLTLLDVFKRSVGRSGTIVMPTFTFSWGKGLPFDVVKSRSEVGSLTEFFRRESGVVRSVQPMHSVAAWGARADEVVKVGKDTFGAGSVFDILHKLNAKILLFGVDLEYCTYLIYVEQMHDVPYRFLKTFRGTIIDGARAYEDSFTYFARPLEGVDNDMRKIEPYLRAHQLLKEVKVGNSGIQAISATDLFEAGMYVLDEDPYALLAKKPPESLRKE